MSRKNYNKLAGLLGAVWAVGGFSIVLLDAINRLSGIALAGIAGGLSPLHWACMVLSIIILAYSEGYRGFQLSFSPRTAARVHYLYNNPDWLSVLLAPFFIVGFFRAERRPFLFAWVGTSMIVGLVVLLNVTPQPWRAIVDAGVVVGLSWGLASFLLSVAAAFSSPAYPYDPMVPGSDWSDSDAAEAAAKV